MCRMCLMQKCAKISLCEFSNQSQLALTNSQRNKNIICPHNFCWEGKGIARISCKQHYQKNENDSVKARDRGGWVIRARGRGEYSVYLRLLYPSGFIRVSATKIRRPDLETKFNKKQIKKVKPNLSILQAWSPRISIE